MIRRVEIVLDACWYVCSRGIICGGGLGALFGTLIIPLFGTVVGAAYGVIFGLLLGIITGTLIGIVTAIFFDTLENHRIFSLLILIAGGFISTFGAFSIFAMWWEDRGTLLERIVRLSKDDFMIIPTALAVVCATFVCNTYAMHFLDWQEERNNPDKMNTLRQRDREFFCD